MHYPLLSQNTKNYNSYTDISQSQKNDYAFYKLIEKHTTQIQEYRNNAWQLFDNIANDMFLFLFKLLCQVCKVVAKYCGFSCVCFFFLCGLLSHSYGL